MTPQINSKTSPLLTLQRNIANEDSGSVCRCVCVVLSDGVDDGTVSYVTYYNDGR